MQKNFVLAITQLFLRHGWLKNKGGLMDTLESHKDIVTKNLYQVIYFLICMEGTEKTARIIDRVYAQCVIDHQTNNPGPGPEAS